MSNELRDLFNVEVDEFQKKAKVSILLIYPLRSLRVKLEFKRRLGRKAPTNRIKL
jgi:hypothetical protein